MGAYENKHGETIMWVKLIVTVAILYVLITQLAALKPPKEKLVDYYNDKATLCKEQGWRLSSTRYYLSCGDETEPKN